MGKIAFKDFQRIMSRDIKDERACIEIEFRVDNSETYQAAWLGKTIDRDTKKVIYWFGLTEDGSQAYDFDSFEQFVDAKVICGKSIKEVWDAVSLLSIDACDVQERLPFYLGIA